MRCDIIADGIIAAAKEVSLSVPLVVRLERTNVEEGKKILAESGLPIVPAKDIGDAATKIVAEVTPAAVRSYRRAGSPLPRPHPKHHVHQPSHHLQHSLQLHQ